MFTYDDKDFEFKFSIGRIELIEQVTEMPTLSNINRTGGLLSIKDLKTYFAYALKEANSDVFFPIKKGMEMCERMIEEQGYEVVCSLVLEALQRDCPFFFPGA